MGTQLYTPLDAYIGATNYNFNQFGFGKSLAIGAVRRMHPRLHFMQVHKKYLKDEKGNIIYDANHQPVIDAEFNATGRMILEESIAMSMAAHKAQAIAMRNLSEQKYVININQMPTGFGGVESETAPTNLKFGDKRPGMRAVRPFESRTPSGQPAINAMHDGGQQ